MSKDDQIAGPFFGASPGPGIDFGAQNGAIFRLFLSIFGHFWSFIATLLAFLWGHFCGVIFVGSIWGPIFTRKKTDSPS